MRPSSLTSFSDVTLTLRIDQRAHALESSLNRIDVLAGAEQFLGQAHLEQIVECETIVAAAADSADARDCA